MLVFEERGKADYPEKNLSEWTQLTLWHRRRDFNPGHIGGRRALSSLRHPLLRVQTDATLLANKVLSQQLPRFLLLCDRPSVAQQCWIRLQTSSNINCWGHARRLHMVFKVFWVVSFPRCTAGPNIVGSCCIRVHTTANTDATTPNIVDPVRLYIVLADNINRVKEKFYTVMVVFVLVLYSPLDASGPWSIVGT